MRIPRELVAEGLKTAPASFVLTPRNAQRRLHVGGDHVSFGLVAGPPNVHDCVNGRRSGNYPDYCNLIKLAQSFDIIHFIGNQPTPPIELPTGTRHLDCYIANVTYSDKPPISLLYSSRSAASGTDGLSKSAQCWPTRSIR